MSSSLTGPEALKRGKPRGFPMGPEVVEILGRHHEVKLWPSLLVAAGDVLGPMALAAVGIWLLRTAPLLLALPANALILVLIARFQRGQENLTHEASHQNWFRPGRRARKRLKRLARLVGARSPRSLARNVNDLVANLCAALPAFNTIKSYWHGHRIHHVHFDSEVDPCRSRFSTVDRAKSSRFVLFIVQGIGPYVSGWWLAFGLNWKSVFLGLLWHSVLWIAPATWLLGWPEGVLVWLVYWVAPFVLILPWVRFISESGKHDYQQQTEFDATISNIGWIHNWYFNPHGDGYHVLHHWDPAIPHYRLRRAHRELLEAEPELYGGKHRHRKRVLENPRVGENAA